MNKNICHLLFSLVAGTLVAISLYLVFMVVPGEKVMGAVQRIFYFHVGSAFACYLAFAIVFLASFAYLGTRERKWDALVEAASEVGFVFCSCCLVTGMIWGYSAWNTAFRIEPRLVSTLVLWMIFLSSIILRHFGEPGKVSAHCSVLGILGALTVPIVIYSIELLPQFAQLHPKVIETGGLKDPLYYLGFGVTSLSWIIFQLLLTWFRYRIALLERNCHGNG